MNNIIILHSEGVCIGVASSVKQKDEIVKAYFDEARQNRVHASPINFTYVKPNILNPHKRGAISGIKDISIQF